MLSESEGHNADSAACRYHLLDPHSLVISCALISRTKVLIFCFPNYETNSFSTLSSKRL